MKDKLKKKLDDIILTWYNVYLCDYGLNKITNKYLRVEMTTALLNKIEEGLPKEEICICSEDGEGPCDCGVKHKNQYRTQVKALLERMRGK